MLNNNVTIDSLPDQMPPMWRVADFQSHFRDFIVADTLSLFRYRDAQGQDDESCPWCARANCTSPSCARSTEHVRQVA